MILCRHGNEEALRRNTESAGPNRQQRTLDGVLSAMNNPITPNEVAETTQVLTDREILEQILRRLTSLETEMIGVKKELRSINSHMRIFIDDYNNVRLKQQDIEKLSDHLADRVEAIEKDRRR